MDLSEFLLSDTGVVPNSRAPVASEQTPAPTTDMNPVVAFAVALGMQTHEEICNRYGLTTAQLEELLLAEPFQKLVEGYRVALVEHGLSFRTKAAVHAEVMLDEVVWKMVQDPTTPSQVKLEAFKAVAKLAGYEPKQAAEGPSGPAFRLVINMNGENGAVAAQRPIIDVE